MILRGEDFTQGLGSINSWSVKSTVWARAGRTHHARLLDGRCLVASSSSTQLGGSFESVGEVAIERERGVVSIEQRRQQQQQQQQEDENKRG